MVGLLGIVCFVMLLYYLFLSFPLEQGAWSERASDTMLMGLKLKTEGITAVKEKSYEMVGMQWLQRRGYFTFAVLITFIATVWCVLRYLGARGITRNWPKLVIEWPQAAPQLTAEKPMTLKDLE